MLASLESNTVMKSVNYAHEEESLTWHKVRSLSGYERLKAAALKQFEQDRDPEVHSVTFCWGWACDVLENPYYGYSRD